MATEVGLSVGERPGQRVHWDRELPHCYIQRAIERICLSLSTASLISTSATIQDQTCSLLSVARGQGLTPNWNKTVYASKGVCVSEAHMHVNEANFRQQETCR